MDNFCDNLEDYSVYLHVFQDGKKYVGCTCRNVRTRWDGGFGYEDQNAMFGAICKFGWNNVRHYILFKGLDKQNALLTEAALIRKWKTYRKSGGYNAHLPDIPGLDDFVLPEFKRVRVEDAREYTENERVARRSDKRKDGDIPGNAKRIRVIDVPLGAFDLLMELGEEFESITEVAERLHARPSSVSYAINNKDRRGRSFTCRGYRFELCN